MNDALGQLDRQTDTDAPWRRQQYKKLVGAPRMSAPEQGLSPQFLAKAASQAANVPAPIAAKTQPTQPTPVKKSTPPSSTQLISRFAAGAEVVSGQSSFAGAATESHVERTITQIAVPPASTPSEERGKTAVTRTDIVMLPSFMTDDCEPVERTVTHVEVRRPRPTATKSRVIDAEPTLTAA